MNLSEQQSNIVMSIIGNEEKIIALTGKAGTGKSTCLVALHKLLKYDVVGPTNKAALVLKSKGIKDAKTIHSAIYAPVFKQVLTDAMFEFTRLDQPTPENSPNAYSITENVIPAWEFVQDTELLGEQLDEKALFSIMKINEWDYFDHWEKSKLRIETSVIVDEASMVTEEQVTDLLSVYNSVILVGDSFQLPPVKGKPALDMATKTYELTEVFRSGDDIVDFVNSLRI
jgi:exodeoxyribonuclease-5